MNSGCNQPAWHSRLQPLLPWSTNSLPVLFPNSQPPGKLSLFPACHKLLSQGGAFWIQVQKILILKKKKKSLQPVTRVSCLPSPLRKATRLYRDSHVTGCRFQHRLLSEALSLRCVSGGWEGRGLWSQWWLQVHLSLSLSPLYCKQRRHFQ